MKMLDEVDGVDKLERRVENLELAFQKLGVVVANLEQPEMGKELHDVCLELYENSKSLGAFRDVIIVFSDSEE